MAWTYKDYAIIRMIIYARISSDSQKDGDGIQSQIHKCEQFATANGLIVERRFIDDGVSGATWDRKGLAQLRQYLEDTFVEGEKVLVVCETVSRFARIVMKYHENKELVTERNGVMHYLNLTLEDTPLGRLFETFAVAQAQSERENNALQTQSRVDSRRDKGYSTAGRLPFGYKYVSIEGEGGKSATTVTKEAKLYKDTYNLILSGNLKNITEVSEYMRANGKVYNNITSVKELFQNKFHLGMIKKHGEWTQGNHKPLITKDEYNEVQNRLWPSTKIKTKSNTLLQEKFPLHGSVVCSETTTIYSYGSQENGSGKKVYMYKSMFPKTLQKTGAKSRSVQREKLHRAYGNTLSNIALSKNIMPLMNIVMDQVIKDKNARYFEQEHERKIQLAQNKKQIETLEKKLVQQKNNALNQVYEKGYAEALEVRKDLEKPLPSPITTVMKNHLAMQVTTYVLHPLKLWESENYKLQRATLGLCFNGLLTYDKTTNKLEGGTSIVAEFYTQKIREVVVEPNWVN